MARRPKLLFVVAATLMLVVTSAVAQSGGGAGAGTAGGASASKGKGAAKTAAAASKGKTFHFVTADQVQFTDVPDRPGIAWAQLWGDAAKDGDSGALVRFKAGTETGWHYHSNAIHLVSISGALTIEPEGGQATELRANAFSNEPPKVKHRTTCPGPDDCVFFLHMEKKFDFVDADAGAKKGTAAPAK